MNRAFTFRFIEHLDIELVGVGRRGGMGRWKQRFFMTDVGSLVRCGGKCMYYWWMVGWVSRADEEWRRIMAQREMRYGVFVFFF